METLTMMPHAFAMKPTHMPVPTMPSNAVVMSSATELRRPDFSEDKSPRSELLCRYPSKLCDNLRSEKRGGGLHRFCAEHRERANINQRRVDQRRRMRRRGAVVSPTQRPGAMDHHSSDEESHLEDDMVALELDTFAFDPNEPILAALTDEDLKVLIAILDQPSSSDVMPIKSEFSM